MELDVSVDSSVTGRKAQGYCDDLHKGVWNRHGADDHDVHAQRDHHDTLVEPHELVVLGETVADEVGFDGFQEVPVEESIHEQVESLFDAIPHLVDDMVLGVDLQAGGDPDVEHADVDGCDEDGGSDHDVERAPAIRNNDSYTVDDNLKK